MAARKRVLAIDSGPLICAGSDERVEATIQEFYDGGATFMIAAPSLAEVIRGSATDAAANRLIKRARWIVATDDAIAREAGRRIAAFVPKGSKKASKAVEYPKSWTIDAIVIATAIRNGATDVFTSDGRDMRALADGELNVIALDD
jgi:predicted nucleic acid-binding protein